MAENRGNPHPMAEVEREMCASVDEFKRGLENAFPRNLSGGPAAYVVDESDAAMVIEVTRRPPRRIGAIELPAMTVRIRFTRGSAEAQAALLAHMDRAMHRGGG
jgi:hypothetical protein